MSNYELWRLKIYFKTPLRLAFRILTLLLPESNSLSWLFSTEIEFLEISFLPENIIDYMATGPNFNWHRLSILIKDVNIDELP